MKTVSRTSPLLKKPVVVPGAPLAAVGVSAGWHARDITAAIAAASLGFIARWTERTAEALQMASDLTDPKG